jgi:hypothetical protein
LGHFLPIQINGEGGTMKYYFFVLLIMLSFVEACATVEQQNQAALSGAAVSSDAGRFDGTWNVTLVCPAAQGAAGYSFQFIAQVKGGVLHGQYENKDYGSNLTLDGKIKPNGEALINANGAIGRDPKYITSSYSHSNMSFYKYHIDGHFTDSRGTGKREEGRVCNYTFVKQ